MRRYIARAFQRKRRVRRVSSGGAVRFFTMDGSRGETRISVVLCDDVAEMRALLRYTLEDDPAVCVVGEAENGVEGARMIAELKPDVVLLDLAMPEMDGLEAIPEIASSSPHTGIIVFSGFAADRMSESAIRSGADRYLEKGAPLDAVISAVHEVAESRRSGGGGGGGDPSGPVNRRAAVWRPWPGLRLGRWSPSLGAG
jgi:CheY-like chemotaxis protein